ncbi:UNVERIFIED_CONTAM: hypothetical protein FKN15_047165 [Acipenser sinensis]
MDITALTTLLQALEHRRETEERQREERYTALIERSPEHRSTTNHIATSGVRNGTMDITALTTLLQALEHRRETEERQREERYTALIERVGLGTAPQTPAIPVMAPPKARAQKMTAEDDIKSCLH